MLESPRQGSVTARVQIEILPILTIYMNNKFAVLTYQGEELNEVD